MNAIVIREFRQAVRSRYIAAMLLLFLLGECLVCGGVLISYSTDVSASTQSVMGNTGRSLFLFLFGVLVAMSMLMVPLYTAVRLAVERSDDSVDLYFLTSLSPHAVIRGKLLAAGGIVLLLFSVSAPFLTMSQALRGIDLPSIAFALVFAFVILMATTMAAICIACLPMTRVFKVIVGLVALGCLVPISAGIIAFTEQVIRNGSALPMSQYWTGLACMAGLYCSVFGLLYVFAVSMVMPPTANRALLTRGTAMALWLLWGALAVCVEHAGQSPPVVAHALPVWFCVFMAGLIGWLAIAFLEDTRVSNRIRRFIPHVPVVRLGAALLCSGRAPGILWTLLLALLTLIVTCHAGRNHDVETMQQLSALFLYVLGAGLTAHLLWRVLCPNLHRFMIVAGAVLLLAVLGVAPILAKCLVSYSSTGSFFMWKVFSISALIDPDNNTELLYHVFAGAIWAGVMLALHVPWFVRELGKYTPLERAAAAPAATAGPDTEQEAGA